MVNLILTTGGIAPFIIFTNDRSAEKITVNMSTNANTDMTEILK